MKVLIANAVHESKDYAMERWLLNVAKLQKEYPADLLLVDNSVGPIYVKTLNSYCKKHGIKNYQVLHIDLPASQEKFERIARSREVIREYFLSKEYDAWFSWESDILIPPNALNTLSQIMNLENYLIVAHNNWTRQTPGEPNYDWGVALIKREALQKYGFILEFGTDPDMPDTYEPSEAWFRTRILRNGGHFIEVQGNINPIIHLDK